MCLSELGQFKEALPGLQKGFGQSADAALRRVSGLQLQRTYTGLGQDDKAVEVALQLTRLYKDDPEILYHSGRLISNYAYLLTMRLAEVAPASVWMHQAAGEANESIKNYDSALEEYKKVLALAPGRPASTTASVASTWRAPSAVHGGRCRGACRARVRAGARHRSHERRRGLRARRACAQGR